MIGGLAFLSPWLLLGLAALPALWWLLRVTPPRPRRVVFPPTELLRDIDDVERTPRRMPWWLLALRLALVAAVILALAEPVLRAGENVTSISRGPLLLILDNGWDAAPDWDERMAEAHAIVDEAGRTGRPVAIVATADGPAQDLDPSSVEEASERLGAIEPRPYLADRASLAPALAEAFDGADAEVVYLAGNVGDERDGAFVSALEALSNGGTTIVADRPLAALLPPSNGPEGVEVAAVRFGDAAGEVVAQDAQGRRLASAPLAFDGAAGSALIELPVQLRNEIARLRIAGEESAGAVQLTDGRFQRRSVGLLAGAGADAQPLLAPLTYVRRALANQVDLTIAEEPSVADGIDALLARDVAVMVLTDVGRLPPATEAEVAEWVNGGGTLVRFASPRLAGDQDSLLPVPLRQGERELGGALSWEDPRAIGAFSAEGPFSNIEVPGDVRVNRQVLADPVRLAQAQVWAELDDGTPLVTAAPQGEGRVVLFHVTADPRWSNLPLSGAFVEMLTAITGTLANAVGNAGRADATGSWTASRVLDGFGRLRAGTDVALLAETDGAIAGPKTPPGLYTREGSLFALNAITEETNLAPLDLAAWEGKRATLAPREEVPLASWLLALAALLAFADAVAMLAMNGRLPSLARLRPAAGAAAGVFLALALMSGTSAAQDETGFALDASLETRLGYVLTGNSMIDEVSRAGLDGLTRFIASRTALEPGAPIGLDVAEDELAFFSFIYWPVDPNAEELNAPTLAKVDAYLRNGGTILFDTRDAGGFDLTGFGTPETVALRRILEGIDVPPLEPVPPEHVLTKAFYLLEDFPGRYRESPLWVESLPTEVEARDRPARGGDGVSPIILTGNDLAAAWAINEDGRFIYPTVPTDPRQREMAFRTGVNLVMYTLTGNYKADQVHVPALLERLGQ